MDSGEVWDVVIFTLCIAAFPLYNCLYYFSSQMSRCCTPLSFYKDAHNMWKTGNKARSLWADRMMGSSAEALLAVHTVRNLLISVSWFAAAEATLVIALLNILTDPGSIQQIENYNMNDPITRGDSFMSVPVKISLSLSSLFISLLLFVQSARLAVHLGFLVRVVPENVNTSIPFRETTIVLTQRMNFQFSVGVRLLFAFVPLTFYSMLGTLALLISTFILILLMFFLDIIPSSSPTLDWLIRTHNESVYEASVLRGNDPSARDLAD